MCLTADSAHHTQTLSPLVAAWFGDDSTTINFKMCRNFQSPLTRKKLQLIDFFGISSIMT